ncbi:MAG: hypothetical protein ACLRZH_01325 [Ruthenibacterium lactatiformans]
MLENDIAHNDATIASLKEEIGQSGLGREAIAPRCGPRGHRRLRAAGGHMRRAHRELEALLESCRTGARLPASGAAW